MCVCVCVCVCVCRVVFLPLFIATMDISEAIITLLEVCQIRVWDCHLSVGTLITLGTRLMGAVLFTYIIIYIVDHLI